MKKLFVFFAITFVFFFVSFQISFAQKDVISTKDKNGNSILVKVNPKTGSAHRVYGLNTNINQYGFDIAKLNRESISTLTNKFLTDYNSIIKIKPPEIKLRRADTVRVLHLANKLRKNNPTT